MIGRFLCRYGWHAWDYRMEKVIRWEIAVHCKRCGKGW